MREQSAGMGAAHGTTGLLVGYGLALAGLAALGPIDGLKDVLARL